MVRKAFRGKCNCSGDLRFLTARALETSPSEGITLKYAESIENINSGIDPVAEYFSWLNETTSILNHLNDGFITKEDSLERESFLTLTDQREADLMVCLGLYENSRSKEAEDRARFIRYKLQKLREMRTAITFLTRPGQDMQTTRSEYDAAIPYYKYFKNLQRLPFGYDLPNNQKPNMGKHEEDQDLAEDYNHYNDVLNKALDEMREREKQSSYQNTSNRDLKQNSEENEDFAGR